MIDNIEIWNKNNNKIPIIVSIPHSGTYLPITMKKNLVDNVVLSNMDWYLSELYLFLKDLGITTLVNNVSRYVIDTNREMNDFENDSYIKNYIYTKTTFNNKIYKKILDNKEINYRIKEYYNPYHDFIADLINDKLTKFNKVYLIDLHSFGKNLEEDIVLGNRNYQTASYEFTDLIETLLKRRGFKIILNKPYNGGYIVKKYANKNVETVQIELSYKKYIEDRIFLNEDYPKIDKSLFIETQEKLKNFFKELIEELKC